MPSETVAIEYYGGWRVTIHANGHASAIRGDSGLWAETIEIMQGLIDWLAAGRPKG